MPPPEYDYYEEALKVVEELRLTAEDSDRRAKIAVFDNKLDVRAMLQHATIQQFSNQHSYQKHLLYALGLSMAEDDGIVLAWTEKVSNSTQSYSAFAGNDERDSFLILLPGIRSDMTWFDPLL